MYRQYLMLAALDRARASWPDEKLESVEPVALDDAFDPPILDRLSYEIVLLKYFWNITSKRGLKNVKDTAKLEPVFGRRAL
jgi:hypothetical protein